MVTQEYYGSCIQVFYMTSTDTKPTTDIKNGSIIVEVDTGKHFRFDKENLTWYDFGYVKVVF